MAVRNRVVHIVDHMEQHYLTMGGWTPGLRVPPPLPPPRCRLRALLRAQSHAEPAQAGCFSPAAVAAPTEPIDGPYPGQQCWTDTAVSERGRCTVC